MAEAITNSERIAEEVAELERAIEDLSVRSVKPGEERELSEKRTLLLNGEQLIEAVDGAITELDGADVVSGRLRAAARLLERVTATAAGRSPGTMYWAPGTHNGEKHTAGHAGAAPFAHSTLIPSDVGLLTPCSTPTTHHIDRGAVFRARGPHFTQHGE